ncbi:retinol-binding protein 2 [Camelus ferus]|nr:retinol-binding protein 2 [Camelus ferus]
MRDQKGPWGSQSNDNFEGYRKALDIDFASCNMSSEFDEDTKGLDNRNVKTLVIWQSDALVSVQKGEKKNRGSKQRVEGNKQYLELTCRDRVSVKRSRSNGATPTMIYALLYITCIQNPEVIFQKEGHGMITLKEWPDRPEAQKPRSPCDIRRIRPDNAKALGRTYLMDHEKFP